MGKNSDHNERTAPVTVTVLLTSNEDETSTWQYGSSPICPRFVVHGTTCLYPGWPLSSAVPSPHQIPRLFQI